MSDVRKYTLRQATAFAKEIVVQRQETLYNTATTTRAAFHAEDDAWRELMKVFEVNRGS